MGFQGWFVDGDLNKTSDKRVWCLQDPDNFPKIFNKTEGFFRLSVTIIMNDINSNGTQLRCMSNGNEQKITFCNVNTTGATCPDYPPTATLATMDMNDPPWNIGLLIGIIALVIILLLFITCEIVKRFRSPGTDYDDNFEVNYTK